MGDAKGGDVGVPPAAAAERGPVPGDIDLDSAGVYYMSVEEFESRSTVEPQSADRESMR